MQAHDEYDNIVMIMFVAVVLLIYVMCWFSRNGLVSMRGQSAMQRIPRNKPKQKRD